MVERIIGVSAPCFRDGVSQLSFVINFWKLILTTHAVIRDKNENMSFPCTISSLVHVHWFSPQVVVDSYVVLLFTRGTKPYKWLVDRGQLADFSLTRWDLRTEQFNEPLKTSSSSLMAQTFNSEPFVLYRRPNSDDMDLRSWWFWKRRMKQLHTASIVCRWDLGHLIIKSNLLLLERIKAVKLPNCFRSFHNSPQQNILIWLTTQRGKGPDFIRRLSFLSLLYSKKRRTNCP